MGFPPACWGEPGGRLLRTVEISWLALVLVMLGGCQEYRDPADAWAEDPDAIVHPVKDSLLSSIANVPVFFLSIDDRPNPKATGLIAALADFGKDSVFGQFDGPVDSVLGELIDATVLSNGEIAVLDRNYGLVRLFSPAMKPRTVLGGFGEGPGEVEDPVAIFEHPRGWITVVDADGVRLERFSLERPEGNTERSPLPVYWAYDGCGIGDRSFVVGTNVAFDFEQRTANLLSPGVVHELDLAGELVNSFAIPYSNMREYEVSSAYGMAYLECEDTQQGGRIWVAYSILGEVHSMDTSGELHWIARLSDLRYPNLIQTPTAMGMDPEQTELIEFITNISLLSDSVLAIHVTSVRRFSRTERDTSVRTYLLEKETGQFLGGFRGSHQVLGGGQGQAVLYEASPHPQISLVEIGR